MKSRTTLIAVYLFLFSGYISAQSGNAKYDKWLTPSYFRGYNILYENPKTLQDFIDFKNCGGNLFQIGTRGFVSEDPPYSPVPQNVAGTDTLVHYCRVAGINYVIAVRSGPGAYDTYLESSGQTGESRIWETGNSTEQTLYAQMLYDIVQRYKDDSLFAGINLLVEPRPKVNYIPANTSELYKFFLENVYNIHMDQVYESWVLKIRSIDTLLPIIVENFAYSTPELFPAYVINGPYIVYSAHNYMPKEYTGADLQNSLAYPGTYWNITYLAQKYYDKSFLKVTIFGRLDAFQQTTGAPVFIGEFGIRYPQIRSYQYIADVMDVCLGYGWHMAMWDWRRGPAEEWNAENFTEVGLSTFFQVLGRFHSPPVPQLLYPPDSAQVGTSVTFTWDSLTAYNTYDIMIQMGDHSRIVATDLTDARYTVSNLFVKPGHYNYWMVRSKNPGGSLANWSAWSPQRSFTVDTASGFKLNITGEPLRFGLGQNYPNPFNPDTRINFSLPEDGFVALEIYDILGRMVALPVNEKKQAGTYSIRFDGSRLSSGIYIYKINIKTSEGSTGYSSVKRMVLLK